jgi:hypothetical protein
VRSTGRYGRSKSEIPPRFLGGERRCPPEDCGGPLGYFEFIESIASKRGKKPKEALEWYGGPYHPEDIDEQNAATASSALPSPSLPNNQKLSRNNPEGLAVPVDHKG